MATKLKDMVAMLICDDTQESVRFYTEVLGFTVTDRMDNVGKTGWASLNHGDVQAYDSQGDNIITETITTAAKNRHAQATMIAALRPMSFLAKNPYVIGVMG